MAKIGIVAIVFVISLCTPIAAQGAGPGTAEKDWREITISDTVGYIIPDEVVRELGLPREEIPDAENAATYYIQAINAMPEEPPPDEQYFAAVKEPWGPEKNELYAWFQETAEARNLLRKAASMERSQFPLITQRPGYTLLAGILLPHLAQMRNFARLLSIEGHFLENEGKVKEALEAYLAIMPLGGHTAKGAILINGLVAIAIHRMGASAIIECLQRHDVPADVLEWLGERLTESERFLPDRSLWIIGERAMARQIVDMPMDRSFGTMAGLREPKGQVWRSLLASRALRILMPDRTIRKDFDNFYGRLEEIAGKRPWEAVSASRKTGERWPPLGSVKDWNILAGMLLPALSKAQVEYVRQICDHDALSIHVALLRYRQKNGRYPERLERLVPDLLDDLPLDPFSGEPFKYQRGGDGWILYSVGADQDDDGGEMLRDYRTGGDIVYRSELQEKPQ